MLNSPLSNSEPWPLSPLFFLFFLFFCSLFLGPTNWPSSFCVLSSFPKLDVSRFRRRQNGRRLRSSIRGRALWRRRARDCLSAPPSPIVQCCECGGRRFAGAAAAPRAGRPEAAQAPADGEFHAQALQSEERAGSRALEARAGEGLGAREHGTSLQTDRSFGDEWRSRLPSS